MRTPPFTASLITLVIVFGLALLYTSAWPLLSFPSKAHDILTVFLSVVMEASPFLLLGSLVSVAIRRTSLIDRVISRVPQNPLLGLPLSASLGTLLPLCECGNMPIARSLVQKGLSPAYATTFLFSAPILNPAVFLSTFIAFRGQPIFLAARLACGFVVALAAGAFVLWNRKKGITIWKDVLSAADDHCHPHGHESFFAGVCREFLAIFPFLAIGSLFTALFQAFVPRDLFFNESFGIIAAIAFMMLFAFIISVCSNTDAFLALGFQGIMPGAAILAFLVFGPMIDTKNVLIYSRIFTVRGIVIVSLFIAELVFLLALLAHKAALL